MSDRRIPSDPIAPWFDRAKAAEARVVELEGQLRLATAMVERAGYHNDKLNAAKVVVDAVESFLKAKGRYHTELEYKNLELTVKQYRKLYAD